jgi:hypothetical protein
MMDKNNVIKELKTFIVGVESGEILAIAISTVEKSKEVGSFTDTGRNWAKLVASVAATQHDLLMIADRDGGEKP